VRISATTLESFRLWRDPEQEWMTEDALIDTIKGVFVPNHKINLGQAFGRVLEDPDRYLIPGGFRVQAGGEIFEFGRDVMEEPLRGIDRRGVLEAKAIAQYGDCDVVSKADHLYGLHLSEFKTTLGPFDFDKYANSCQWRFMCDGFQPNRITYHVFCLDEATNGVISLKDVHRFDLFPYIGLRQECEELVEDFRQYVILRGLDEILRARQAAA
jgi:hypothetical protein